MYRLSRNKRKMICHQNPGPVYYGLAKNTTLELGLEPETSWPVIKYVVTVTNVGLRTYILKIHKIKFKGSKNTKLFYSIENESVQHISRKIRWLHQIDWLEKESYHNRLFLLKKNNRMHHKGEFTSLSSQNVYCTGLY